MARPAPPAAAGPKPTAVSRKVPAATGAAVGRRQVQVLERLREMIMLGELKAGEHVQEIPLSMALGVSRTPIREALVVLAHEGLLVYRANRGYVVREFHLKDVLNAYLVRECLEGLACRQLAEDGIDARSAEQLRACLAAGDRIFAIGYLTEQGVEPWRQVNDGFHTTLLHATGKGATPPQERCSRSTR